MSRGRDVALASHCPRHASSSSQLHPSKQSGTRRCRDSFSEGLIMFRMLTVATGALMLVLTMGLKASPRDHSLYVTFGQSVEIPGVTLTPGTYIFEQENPDTATNVVRVLSRDRSHVFLTQFADRVQRPSGASPEQTVFMGEAPENQPQEVMS